MREKMAHGMLCCWPVNHIMKSKIMERSWQILIFNVLRSFSNRRIVCIELPTGKRNPSNHGKCGWRSVKGHLYRSNIGIHDDTWNLCLNRDTGTIAIKYSLLKGVGERKEQKKKNKAQECILKRSRREARTVFCTIWEWSIILILFVWNKQQVIGGSLIDRKVVRHCQIQCSKHQTEMDWRVWGNHLDFPI